MNPLLLITLTILTTITLNAKTTMCFKENHKSMITIETTKLDGGECKSSKSLTDMKNEGWNVEDIKIENSNSGKNYIYVLKKDEATFTSFDEKKLEEKILKRLEKAKEDEAVEKLVQLKLGMANNGKKIYENSCITCHGEKADKEAYNTARPLINLSLFDFQQAIRDYTMGEYDRGMAMVMKPQAMSLSTSKIKDIYAYIQTLKPKKEEKPSN